MKKLLLILLIAFTVSCEDSVDLCETNDCFVVQFVIKRNSPQGYWRTSEIRAKRQCDGSIFTYQMGREELPSIGDVICIDQSNLNIID
tara:strand:- start:892 stop:1155 length:264 start_codon:yes stop_codon:yes gene_type:complete